MHTFLIIYKGEGHMQTLSCKVYGGGHVHIDFFITFGGGHVHLQVVVLRIEGAGQVVFGQMQTLLISIQGGLHKTTAEFE